MKKTLSSMLALIMTLAMILGCVSFAGAENAAAKHRKMQPK